jgi:hypothetical protein
MHSIKKLSTAITLVALSLIIGVTSARGDSSYPVNYFGTNLTPVTTTLSYNYDFLTGALVPGTATATALAINNVFLTRVSDPAPPDSRNGATFFGTAEPVHFCDSSGICDTVVYQQSVCPVYPPSPPGPQPTCFSQGTFTFGGFVTRNVKGDTLDQLTYLASQYYIQYGCDGGGSPRFQIDMSNGNNIFVYFGTYPSFADCLPSNTWQPACPSTQCPTPNMASDSAGLRWDSTQIGGPFYGTYSTAVTLANAQGLTISSVSVITDGGWSTGNAGTSNGQTFYFQSIQVNGVTRFP